MFHYGEVSKFQPSIFVIKRYKEERPRKAGVAFSEASKTRDLSIA